MRTMWDALETGGFGPHGQPHDFRSRCPGHDGDNPDALHVVEGANGAAVLWCFRSCQAIEVLRALDLNWQAIFPDGDRRARLPKGIARPVEPITLILDALVSLDLPCRPTASEGFWVATCPVCLSSDMWIVSEDENRRRNRVRMACFNGCEQHKILDTLAGVIAS